MIRIWLRFGNYCLFYTSVIIRWFSSLNFYISSL